MSSAPNVPGRRELQRASRAVTVAARRLTRIWALSLLAAVLFVPLGAAMTVVTLTLGQPSTKPYALFGAVFTAALAYNVTRFLPHPPEDLFAGVTWSRRMPSSSPTG